MRRTLQQRQGSPVPTVDIPEREKLAQALGRPPTLAEIVTAMEVDEERVL